MTSRLVALCFDANDPLRLARFWAAALRWEIDDETQDAIGLVQTDDTSFRLVFVPAPEQKVGHNRLHFDLTSRSIDDQQESVATLVELGARHIDIGQSPDEGHVVLAEGGSCMAFRTWARGARSRRRQPEGTRVEPIVWVILIIAVLALMVLVVLMRRRRSGSVIAVGRRKGGGV